MKPWHTKRWKEMRNQRIGDTCEQCGSKKAPFVLQHFGHYEDLPFAPTRDSVVRELMGEYDAFPVKPTLERPACPKCNKRSISKRKIKPTWRCIRCRNEFNDPLTVEVKIDRRTGKEENEQYRLQCWKTFEKFQISHTDIVDKRHQEKLEEHEKLRQSSYENYMSGEGTATFCKKCAFLWDVKGLMLCSQCKTGYHAFQYNNCYNCLPNTRKNKYNRILRVKSCTR